jgi:hypothetical protein
LLEAQIAKVLRNTRPDAGNRLEFTWSLVAHSRCPFANCHRRFLSSCAVS